MSQAEDLLNGIAVDDDAVISSPYVEDEPHVIIGLDRFIKVPDSLKRIAVQYDHNMRTVTFDCPRYYDGRDMSEMRVYIIAIGHDKTPHGYIADNVRVDTDDTNMMHFDWTINRPMTDVKGSLVLQVCARRTDSDGNSINHWNTELNKDLYISEGSECVEAFEYEYPDIITQLLDRMDAVEAIATPEAMQGYTNAWLEEHHSYIVEEASGETITLTYSSYMKPKGLKLYGKTTQDGTPSPDAPVELASAGSSGSINVVVSGKNLWGSDEETVIKSEDFALPVPLPPGAYTISAAVTSGDTDATVCTLGLYCSISKKWEYASFEFDGTRRTATKTLTEPVTIIRLNASNSLSSGEGDTAVWREVQIELGVAATAYEAFREPQILTVSTPNGLSGIPVGSGGNYTDENGQQWICDYVDFANGKYVQNVFKYALTGEEAFGETSSNYTLYSNRMGFLGKGNSLVLSTDMPVATRMNAAQSLLLTKTIFGFDSLSEFAAYISERYASGNPVEVIYILDSPIETDLTEAELAAYAALHTNYPNTTVFNDGGVDMEVKYAADTKMYIDKKFAELAEAIVNNA